MRIGIPFVYLFSVFSSVHFPSLLLFLLLFILLCINCGNDKCVKQFPLDTLQKCIVIMLDEKHSSLSEIMTEIKCGSRGMNKTPEITKTMTRLKLDNLNQSLRQRLDVLGRSRQPAIMKWDTQLALHQIAVPFPWLFFAILDVSPF